ncbi:IclR family transcriptional regulator [Natronosporangium hydrolyticum]|uniref:IclR family transcriptional regulator n=1 Tax=Natronosporangium hydrolyticum TaxID=2811111 RepID=UPI001EFA22A7|nr:IclR family transcriptional regulator [Natronosporangium hydrolyticum]
MIEQWLTGPRGRGSAPAPRDLVQSVRRAVQLLEIIGSEPGLSVKQMARRLEMNPTTAYHLIRTLVYEGYLIRGEVGNYTMGPAVSDRFRDLARSLRGPDHVTLAMRRAVVESGYSHYLARLVGGRVTVTAVVEGPYSPWLEDLVPGFDDAAHATAMGKAMLSLLEPHRRERYLKESGMRPFTEATVTDPLALDADLAAGRKRGMQIDTGQFRPGVACGAVPVISDGPLDQLAVLGCSLPLRDFMHSAKELRTRLQATARRLAPLLCGDVDQSPPEPEPPSSGDASES